MWKTLKFPRCFEVYAALNEEADKGLVWMFDTSLESGRTIILERPKAKKWHLFKRRVYCTYRAMDHNFVVRYNEQKHTRKIDPDDSWLCSPAVAYKKDSDRKKLESIIVINEWYRNALGGLIRGKRVRLVVRKPWCPPWANLRATCHHPDPGVRVATRLGVLGTWLGIIGLLFALEEPLKDQLKCYSTHPMLIAVVMPAVIIGILCYIAARGVDGKVEKNLNKDVCRDLIPGNKGACER